MAHRKTDEVDISIDESTHRALPTLKERLVYALTSVAFGIILVQVLSFWMFPVAGLGGLDVLSYFGYDFVGVALVYILAFLVVCAVLGWFLGKSFINRLWNYLDYWKFW